MGTLMVCAFAQMVDPRSSCHTVSVDPETASASRAVPGPEASTDVCAGVGGSSTHIPPDDVGVAPARPPDAVTAWVTGSPADAVQPAAEDPGDDAGVAVA